MEAEKAKEQLARGEEGISLEESGTAPFPWYVHPGWARRFPWLLQGTTGRRPPRGTGTNGVILDDFRLFPVSGDRLSNWEALREWSGFPELVHAPQPHGSHIAFHRAGGQGLRLGPEGDGHLTPDAGVLLAVTVADCVPVAMVVPHLPAVALLHAGWRGVAAGILPRALREVSTRLGVEPSEVEIHLGPSICGRCYRVGSEVAEALGVECGPEPEGCLVDLRGILRRQAEAEGVRDSALSTSGHCTLCGPGLFHSHRAGHAGRQISFLGIVPGVER